jgi:RNA polymerase sigma-70 factor (ECF subfamily)
MEDETHLVRAMARRDRSAWDVMYRRHVGDVFGLAYHLVGGDRHVAEDLNQEVWLLAIEQFERFDPARGTFRDWLLGTARHRTLRHHRCATGRAIGSQPDSPDDGLPPPDLLERSERADVVRAALICLPDGSRGVLLDKYAEGLSVAEIAARTGRSAKAVESLLSRARGQLRALLLPYFSPPTGGQHHEPTDARPT